MLSIPSYISFSHVLNIQSERQTQMAKLRRPAALLLDSDGDTPAFVEIDRLLRLWHRDDQHPVFAEAALHPLGLAALASQLVQVSKGGRDQGAVRLLLLLPPFLGFLLTSLKGLRHQLLRLLLTKVDCHRDLKSDRQELLSVRRPQPNSPC